MVIGFFFVKACKDDAVRTKHDFRYQMGAKKVHFYRYYHIVQGRATRLVSDLKELSYKGRKNEFGFI